MDYFAPGIKTDSKVQCLLEVIEPMGNEIFLYLNTDIHQFVARISAREMQAVGQMQDLVFNMEKAHFFDPETESYIK